jgi:hypothetical protein
VPCSESYDTRTTRLAEERDVVFGERGGKSVWKVFMMRERCGGVIGDGGGKDARTSLEVCQYEKLDGCKVRANEREAG